MTEEFWAQHKVRLITRKCFSCGKQIYRDDIVYERSYTKSGQPTYFCESCAKKLKSKKVEHKNLFNFDDK